MRVRLYTKQECSLCEDAREQLFRLGNTRQAVFELEEIDIRSSMELFSAYRYDVPVVTVDGVERLKLKFTDDELLKALT